MGQNMCAGNREEPQRLNMGIFHSAVCHRKNENSSPFLRKKIRKAERKLGHLNDLYSDLKEKKRFTQQLKQIRSRNRSNSFS